MFIKKLSVGNLAANCYIIADESKKAVVIDPGAQADKILEVINTNDLEVEYVINTHGHSDHIAANSSLIKATDSQLLIHKDDDEFLSNPKLNLSSLLGISEKNYCKADKLLEDGDQINCGNLTIDVIHTPGHTPGSICLKANDILFTGDTLFSIGVGRTDFPKCSKQALEESINQILEFNDELKIYPGHGSTSTLGKVKEKNPYI